MSGADPVVVVTTMPLSATARSDLGELLGPGYVVVDIKTAPASADIVLTTVVSGQSIGLLRGLFPQARVLLTELHDAERGIRYAGPLTRAMESGPDGYFVAHDLEALSPIVQSQAHLQLGGRGGSGHEFTNVLDPTPGAEPSERDGPIEPSEGVITWLTEGDRDPPPGELLHLRAIDDAVATILQTAAPRESPLWSTLVAECVVHLVRDGRARVVVDARDVPARTLAELKLHVSIEGIRNA